ncbi:MAG: 6-phosphofructokinase, partial [Propionibacteriaceae bacterium]|nr:6-phosphofructokinase [Propionibacteriaceae bacterium]
MRPLLTSPEELRSAGQGRAVAVMTGGGDAQGMNAALRAVVRTAISAGAEAYAIHEGYQGMIDDDITPARWDSVAGILNRGGTIIGTFRSDEFRERSGRLKAALNLVSRGIDRVVIIGGDGSLTGLNVFAAEWPDLLDELVAQGRLAPEARAAHSRLVFAGLVGSIDNDLCGTDQTIGADSALHRIQDAIDAVASTAASHQRAFVVEVMGRHCGYLALMSAISGGCDYVVIPERPPAPGWEQEMCDQLRRGRLAGRKDSIVILAEGAVDREGR